MVTRIWFITIEWLAGFFDGEGCAELRKLIRTGRLYPRLSLGQKDERILEAVQVTFGGKLYRNTNSNVARLIWLGEDAAKLARMLLPYSKCKLRQLELLLEAMEVPTDARGPFDLALRAEKKNVKVSLCPSRS